MADPSSEPVGTVGVGEEVPELGDDLESATFAMVRPCELKVQCLLGSGAQANVFKAEWTRSFSSGVSSIVVAVKRMFEDADAVYRDREALGLLTEHANLVKCFDATVDPPYLIVTGFCAGGALFDILYNDESGVKLSLRQRVKILYDVAAGMNYLHSQKPCILHRDLKSSNVLLTKPIKSSDQEIVAKVGDFGLSRDAPGQQPRTQEALTAGVGTWRWMAPEVFECEGQVSYDQKIDIYSFAMFMYEVLSEKLPHSEDYPSDVPDPRMGLHVCMGMRPKLDDLDRTYPAVLLELMTQAWDSDPDERPDFEILEKSLQELYSSLPGPL